MFKNQLQVLAQQSCFNLPASTCLREGPDHAPRFKAAVTFNGEQIESPRFFTTIRWAKHAAAEVSLPALARRGPSYSLAARILVVVIKQLNRDGNQGNKEFLVGGPHAQFTASSKPCQRILLHPFSAGQ